jgi:hypothetical protein
MYKVSFSEISVMTIPHFSDIHFEFCLESRLPECCGRKNMMVRPSEVIMTVVNPPSYSAPSYSDQFHFSKAYLMSHINRGINECTQSNRNAQSIPS